MSGQRASNPQQTLALLLSKKDQLQEELRTVEKQVVLPPCNFYISSLRNVSEIYITLGIVVSNDMLTRYSSQFM